MRDMLSAKLRWLLRGLFLAALVILILTGIVIVSWRGQGTDPASLLATSLSTLALLGVGAALYYQAQQTEISRLEAARNHRADLIQFAIEKPRLLAAWGFDVSDEAKAQIEAYASMVFAYLWMAYDLKKLTEAELRWTCERVFHNDDIAAWWTMAGSIYHESERRIGRRQFARIVDAMHADRSPPPVPDEATQPAPPQRTRS